MASTLTASTADTVQLKWAGIPARFSDRSLGPISERPPIWELHLLDRSVQRYKARRWCDCISATALSKLERMGSVKEIEEAVLRLSASHSEGISSPKPWRQFAPTPNRTFSLSSSFW
jgi:hypothetical protein